jgi:hypothetical protein
MPTLTTSVAVHHLVEVHLVATLGTGNGRPSPRKKGIIALMPTFFVDSCAEFLLGQVLGDLSKRVHSHTFLL